MLLRTRSILIAATIIAMEPSALAHDPRDDEPLAPLPPPSASHPDGPLDVHTIRWPRVPPSLPLLELVFQTGYSVPIGKTESGPHAIGDAYGPAVPLWFEAGARATPNVLVGLYGSASIGIPCKEGVTCTGITTRIGVMGRVRLRPSEPVMPWIGYAVGYESSSSDALSSSGIEFGHVSVGADFRADEAWVFGPVFDCSLGQYSHQTVPSGGADAPVAKRALHGWLSLGFRVAWML